ncbi:MAG TPA: hypothetical protein VHO06_09845 [Polyangia bacterium]|nr:hypothetical protein [Polyangia bacterium]
MRLTMGLLCGLALAGTGCGGGGGSDSALVSCTESENIGSGTLKICVETTANERQALQQSCTQSSGGSGVGITFADAPCSHVGALGACRVTAGGVVEDGWYYNIGSADAAGYVGETSADIQMLCAEEGATFLPP